MHYKSAHISCTSAPRPEQFSQLMVDEIAVHLWRAGLQYAEILNCSNYQAGRCIPSCHQLWTNENNNIPPLQQFEDLYGTHVPASGRCLML